MLSGQRAPAKRRCCMYHPDAFIPFEERISHQQQNTYLSDPNRIAAQRHQWEQEQFVHAQAVRDGEAVEEIQLMEEVVGSIPDAAQPLRGATRAFSRMRSGNEAPYEREAREESPVRRSLSRSRVSSRSPSPSPSTVPECYMVTSDIEDDYFRARSTADLNREVKDHRLFIDRAALGSKLIENLIADKEKPTRIIYRRKNQLKGKSYVAEGLSPPEMSSTENSQRLPIWKTILELFH